MTSNDLNGDIYNSLLNNESIKLMHREISLMIIFLFGFFYMGHAVLNSNVNAKMMFGVLVSLHYLFPLVLTLVCFIVLFYKFFKIYKNVVTRIYFENDILKFSGLFFSFNVSEIYFYGVEDNKKWSYLDGFRKKYVNLICINDLNGKKYYLPFNNQTKENLLIILCK